MKRICLLLLAAATASVFLTGMGKTPAEKPGDIPRMTVDELKGRLGDSELVIIDVRTDEDWTGSRQKIAGALRADPEAPEGWAADYNKEKTVVLYCA